MTDPASEPGPLDRLPGQAVQIGDSERDPTISQVSPHIIERGATWFITMGNENSPGPKLFGMSGHVIERGVYEDVLGITLD